ncbi:glycerol 3-phosphate dehydrogenase (NAD(P)+) [Desulfocicer vacuolatum DSM 3385]|uniref:Glycerol-3-phosphate dehydrogenase [NAD(P)+] n=1 Tax=Desulfocicer vacuolatum DSM 3385 TaxID=1121400 RepID=A0A1W1YN61_9BACT|nr:NAD(P)H-dependent glycerol-3-phosphate dehydrogenase [Desulfocicer vacuolatum]SMC37566.1 glycerol 3-phosphate dehydrogenase (NAD(P)+) [Desulfocicer vacuolatum DSM 3385]
MAGAIEDIEKIGVIGAGSWGTALANLLADKGHKVDLWAYETEVVQDIMTHRENKMFLPGIALSPNLIPSNDLEQVVKSNKIILVVVPSHTMRDMGGKMAPFIAEDTIVITASKGIEDGTYLTMYGVLKECLPSLNPHNIAVLSGPSFAKEVALKVPTAISVGGKDNAVATRVQHIFATDYFRIYVNDDPIGLELGGAVKNVIAIAAGFVDGVGLGLNTRAGLITRGLAEIRRLGLHMGANPHTFSGLSGVGDLILTCTGDLSRNYTVGKQLGRGMTLAEIQAERRTVAEGVRNTKSIYHLAKKLDIELPIINEVYRALYENSNPEKAITRLMTRPLGHETSEIDKYAARSHK